MLPLPLPPTTTPDPLALPSPLLPPPPLVPWNGLLVSAVTLLTFSGTSQWLQSQRLVQPATTAHSQHLSWRWVNVLLSLFHSLVSGLWSVYW